MKSRHLSLLLSCHSFLVYAIFYIVHIVLSVKHFLAKLINPTYRLPLVGVFFRAVMTIYHAKGQMLKQCGATSSAGFTR